MKKTILLSILLIAFSFIGKAQTLETLNYVVTYKWGLIQKDAGDVVITKKRAGDGYELKLIAKSKPWADKIYKLRDTLTSYTGKEKYMPEKYIYVAHEKNTYRHDEIKFTYTDGIVKGWVERYKEGKDGKISRGNATLEGSGAVYDMLSVFFFLRDLNYSAMRQGDKVVTTVFSGEKKERLEIRYEGIENVKLKDKSEHETWHIVFKFTQDGGKKSSDDINCYVSTLGSHIPLLIVGTLPVGQIRINYMGGS